MSIEFDPETGLPTVAHGLYGYIPPMLVRFEGKLYFVIDGYDDTWGPYTEEEAKAIMDDIRSIVKRIRLGEIDRFDDAFPALDHTVTTKPRFIEIGLRKMAIGLGEPEPGKDWRPTERPGEYVRGEETVGDRLHDAWYTHIFEDEHSVPDPSFEVVWTVDKGVN